MFCMKCGKKIDDDSKFCPFCGSAIGNTTQSNEQTQRMSMSSQIPSLSALKAVKKPISKNAVVGMAACLVAVLIVVGVVKAFSGGTVKEELECGLKYEIPKGFSETTSYGGTHKTYQFSGSNDYKDFQIYVDVYEDEYLEDESPRDVPTETLNWTFPNGADFMQAECEFNHMAANGKESWYKISIKVFSPENDRDSRFEITEKIADSVDISDLRYGE